MRIPFQSLLIAAVVLCLGGVVGAAPPRAPNPTLSPQLPPGTLVYADYDIANIQSVRIETSGGGYAGTPFPSELAQTPRVIVANMRDDRKHIFYLTRPADQLCYQMALTAWAGKRKGLQLAYASDSILDSSYHTVVRTLVGCTAW